MIRKARFQNYKSLRDTWVDLERLTVFVGPNASGKSSILQATDALCDVFRIQGAEAFLIGSAENAKAYINNAKSRGAEEGEVELACNAGGTWYRYRTRTVQPPPPSPQSRAVDPAAWHGGGRGFAIHPEGEGWKQWKAEQNKPSPLPSSILLRLEVSNLTQPGSGQPGMGVMGASDPTVMSPRGVGLHSALANMALNEPDTWEQLKKDLNRIIPTVRRLRHGKGSNIQHAPLLFDTDGADSLPADQVSEGTLLVLGLLATLHSAERPGLLLLDDLDRGLHPRAQKDLILLLRGLLEANPDLQILATTHSPYMLDCLEPGEVRMTFLGEGGATACAPLASHPQFPKWKDEMTPGEMWSLFGEKWVAEGEVPA